MLLEAIFTRTNLMKQRPCMEYLFGKFWNTATFYGTAYKLMPVLTTKQISQNTICIFHEKTTKILLN